MIQKNNSKIAILNDTQIGIHNDSMIFAKNQKKFFEEIFFPYCIDNNIKLIFHLGDYFDNRRKIDGKILKIHKECFLDKLKEYDMEMVVIVGNHDIYYDHSNDVCIPKEIFSTYTNISLIEKPTIFQLGNFKVGVIPWIHNNNRKECFEKIEEYPLSGVKILFGHFDITGFEFMKGFLQHKGLISSPDIFSPYTHVYSGHYHSKQTKGNITYLGSQSQFTWADYGEEKFFHVLDTRSGEMIPIKNPFELFEKVEYVENMDVSNIRDKCEGKFIKVIIGSEVDSNSAVETFLDEMRKINTLKLEIIENVFTVDKKLENNSLHDDNSISPIFDTQTIIKNLIELNSTLDEKLKDKVLKEIYTIYNEAVSSEMGLISSGGDGS